MIERYTRPALGALWTDEARMEAWRRVEVAACEEMEGPTAADLEAIRGATFTVEAVKERERVTDHDVAAFVDVLQASAGPGGRWIHFGLTSSDVLDTALALQLQAAGEVVVAGARELVAALAARAREHADTVCVGRTHGVHAEPTTFGLKLAGFAFEAHRNAERLERAFAQASVGAISGAVGTYSATSPEFEERVLARLGLEREAVSTQVVPRDRHAELLQAIALAGAGLERLATEVRHLQRTEVREAEEPFRAGQKGSSAMPHKRNPITTERITGPRARAARQRLGRGGERRPVARARHLALGRRAGDPARLDHPARLPPAPGAARRQRAGRARRPHAREPRPHARRAVLPARPARARRAAGCSATTPTASCRRTPSAPGTRPPRCASCSRRAISASTSTRSSTSPTTRATRARSSTASTPSLPADAAVAG